MGCDIHGYVEKEGGGYWWDYTGRLFLGRDYAMFGLLAGVRGYGPPVVEPRGFPGNASFTVLDEYTMYITDSKCEWGGCHVATADEAGKWVRQGCSVYVRDDRKRITHPDWHTPSYLTLDELNEVFRAYVTQTGRAVSERWQAVAAIMKALGGGRFVFWFDN